MLFICDISVSLRSVAGLGVRLAPLSKFSSPWLCHWDETGVQYPMTSLGKGLVDPGWAERGSWTRSRMREGSGLHPQFKISNQSHLFVISVEIFFSCYYGDYDAFFDCNFAGSLIRPCGLSLQLRG